VALAWPEENGENIGEAGEEILYPEAYQLWRNRPASQRGVILKTARKRRGEKLSKYSVSQPVAKAKKLKKREENSNEEEERNGEEAKPASEEEVSA